MPSPLIVAPLPSYSPVTVFQIRYSDPHPAETNAAHVARLAEAFALSVQDVRIIMAAGDDHIDLYGRIAE